MDLSGDREAKCFRRNNELIRHAKRDIRVMHNSIFRVGFCTSDKSLRLHPSPIVVYLAMHLHYESDESTPSRESAVTGTQTLTLRPWYQPVEREGEDRFGQWSC